MANILVTGGSGQLGTSIKVRVPNGTPNRYLFADIDTLDITDRGAVEEYLNAFNIDVVINCAAYTDVESAEADPHSAHSLNAGAVENLARVLEAREGVLIHISTDYVFGDGGDNTPITEDETPAPTGVYGLTKLQGEDAIVNSGVRHLIFRTSWLYSEFGGNFVKTMLNLLETKPGIKVVADQVGSPTYAGDLALFLINLIESKKYKIAEGIFNYTDEGVASWYDFAQSIRDISGKTGCKIEPCRSSEFPSKVKRPSYSVLDKEKVKTTFGIEIPWWRDSLKKFLRHD